MLTCIRGYSNQAKFPIICRHKVWSNVHTPMGKSYLKHSAAGFQSIQQFGCNLAAIGHRFIANIIKILLLLLLIIIITSRGCDATREDFFCCLTNLLSPWFWPPLEVNQIQAHRTCYIDMYVAVCLLSSTVRGFVNDWMNSFSEATARW